MASYKCCCKKERLKSKGDRLELGAEAHSRFLCFVISHSDGYLKDVAVGIQ